MNTKQVQKFVTRYLDALDCHVIEKGAAHIIVKLSPEADKDLTNRSYYWSFVENTGAPAETVTFCFIFDPDKMKTEEGGPASPAAYTGAAPGIVAGGTPSAPGSSVPPGTASPLAVAATPGTASPLAAAATPGTASPLAAAATPGTASPPAVSAPLGSSGPPAFAAPPVTSGPGSPFTPATTPAAATAQPSGDTGAPGAAVSPAVTHAVPPGQAAAPVTAAAADAGPAGATQSAGQAPLQPGAGPAVSVQPASAPQSILAGLVTFAPPQQTVRMPRDEVTFGSRRLEQIFAAVCRRGKCVRLFEEPKAAARAGGISYSTWLCVNYKVELTCDMKREEMHSLGIHLGTGRLVDRFVERMPDLKLTPKLPAGLPLQQARFTLSRAAAQLENEVERRVRLLDHSWADEALSRLEEELAIIDVYYAELLATVDDDAKPQIEALYNGRRDETYWQYRPRITATIVNCGLFHLLTDPEQL